MDMIFDERHRQFGSGGKEQNVPLRNKMPVSWFVASQMTRLASELLMFQLIQMEEKYFGGLKSLIRDSAAGLLN
jgi:hypothetical protein